MRGRSGRLALRPGAVLAGRYRLLDPIGDGGMSTVWRAYDAAAGRCCAVKVLTERHPVALLRLVQEQSLRLRHPHLLPIDCWAADDSCAVVAMPLARGGSLAELSRRRGPLPVGVVVVLLDQLLAALETVHRAGVVHRDVKPANLLLAATGRGRPHLWLADFGVAVQPDGPRLTLDGGVVGTDGYMPAEQRRGEAPRPWWDVHAAAVVAGELLGPAYAARAGGRELARVLGAMREERIDASAARGLLAGLQVPPTEAWPVSGMPVVGDVLGPDPAAWRLRALGDRLPVGALVAVALLLSTLSLVVALTG